MDLGKVTSNELSTKTLYNKLSLVVIKCRKCRNTLDAHCLCRIVSLHLIELNDMQKLI